MIDTYGAKEVISRLDSLNLLLQEQTSETIDDFIVENSDYATLTKIAIASIFMKNCYSFKDFGRTPKPFHKRHYNSYESEQPNRNWIHLLINIIRQGIRSGSVSTENKVKIITFNYDTILEFVLEKQFSNTQAGYENWANYIDIIHVHGQCGFIENPQGAPQAQCQKWANGIHVVNEAVIPDDIQTNRKKAKKLIGEAKEIYFCGFSFAAPNCHLLGLDSLQAGMDGNLISVCNYDGNVGVSRILNKISDKSSVDYSNTMYPQIGSGRVKFELDEASGSPEKPITVVDWLKLGYLGELPG